MAKRAMGWRLPILVALFALASSNKHGSSVPNETKPRRQTVFLSCEAAIQSCSSHFGDMTSYPNIAAGKCMMAFCEYLYSLFIFVLKGFRGFNLVLGGVEVPSNPAGKRGFIFDEAHERSSTVRFNNIAGEEHANWQGRS